MIQPTIGRIVYFFQKMTGLGVPDVGPLAAIITHVWTDRMVNLCVFNSNGGSKGHASVTLRQPEDDVPGSPDWCEWMPYQVKKPMGSESGEKAAGEQVV